MPVAATTSLPAPRTESLPSAHQPKERLLALTGLRTLLALGIVLFHFTPAGLGPLYPIIDNGFVFVSFFFLISGYILSYNYLDRPERLRLKDFWVARLSRLYPIYLFSLVLFTEMLITEWHVRSHRHFFEGAISSVILMQGWFPHLATFWNTVTWTLSCEIMLYAAFPWLLRLRWPDAPSALVGLIVLFWAVGLVPHMAYLFVNPDHLATFTAAGHRWVDANRFSDGLWINWLKYTPAPYLCTFLAGIALGKLQIIITPSRWQRFSIAVAGFAAAWITFYVLIRHLPYVMIHGGLLTPIFALVIIGLSGPHPLASVFAWRPLVEVGAASYCLYLLHFNAFILLHTHHVPERLHVARFDPWFSYVFVVLFAVACRHLIEKPCQEAISAWWKRRKSRLADLNAI